MKNLGINIWQRVAGYPKTHYEILQERENQMKQKNISESEKLMKIQEILFKIQNQLDGKKSLDQHQKVDETFPNEKITQGIFDQNEIQINNNILNKNNKLKERNEVVYKHPFGRISKPTTKK